MGCVRLDTAKKVAAAAAEAAACKGVGTFAQHCDCEWKLHLYERGFPGARGVGHLASRIWALVASAEG
jgi:hypothetical protein